MGETLEIVDRAVIERDRDLDRGIAICGILRRVNNPVDQGCERNDLASGIGNELQIRRKSDMVVASIVAADDVV